MPSEHKDALPKGKSCFDSVTDVNLNGWAALHVVARYDKHECVQTLVAREANIETHDSDHKTPIQLGLWKYYLDKFKLGCKSVKILVKAKAEIDHLKRVEQARIGRCMENDFYNVFCKPFIIL